MTLLMLPYLTPRTHAHATLCPALRPPVSAPHPYAQPAAPPHHRTCCTTACSAHTRRTAGVATPHLTTCTHELRATRRCEHTACATYKPIATHDAHACSTPRPCTSRHARNPPRISPHAAHAVHPAPCRTHRARTRRCASHLTPRMPRTQRRA
ncbi:hypothetical protein GGX14DRAFT_410286, partial [Mycena pura]